MLYHNSTDFRNGMKLASAVRYTGTVDSYKIYRRGTEDIYCLKVNDVFIGTYSSVVMAEGVVYGLLIRKGSRPIAHSDTPQPLGLSQINLRPGMANGRNICTYALPLVVIPHGEA